MTEEELTEQVQKTLRRFDNMDVIGPGWSKTGRGNFMFNPEVAGGVGGGSGGVSPPPPGCPTATSLVVTFSGISLCGCVAEASGGSAMVINDAGINGPKVVTLTSPGLWEAFVHVATVGIWATTDCSGSPTSTHDEAHIIVQCGDALGICPGTTGWTIQYFDDSFNTSFFTSHVGPSLLPVTLGNALGCGGIPTGCPYSVTGQVQITNGGTATIST